MHINLVTVGETTLAEIQTDNVVLHSAQDALDLLANCAYQGADKIIIPKEILTPDFFELKSGIAGEILQKFSTYRAQLAIVGDFSAYTSKSLRDFIFESNKVGRINFVDSVEEAKRKLTT
ncbi:DUF4180 domain-containing protein [Spirosoma sp.]|uniref:DUF4180 domain-containing protein n=1 Tax=Spirosoma sp. TaxID=1899569 RepID=UPI003B3B35F7